MEAQVKKKIIISSWFIKLFEAIVILSMLSIMTSSSPAFIPLAATIIGVYKVWIWFYVVAWSLVVLGIYLMKRVLIEKAEEMESVLTTEEVKKAILENQINIPKKNYVISDIVSWSLIITAFFFHSYVIVVLGIISEISCFYVRNGAREISRYIEEHSEEKQNKELN